MTRKGAVCRDDLVSRTQRLGDDYRFVRLDAPDEEPLLSGMFEVTELRPGLVLQRTHLRDLRAMTTEVELRPALGVVVLLEGSAEVTLGGRSVGIGGRGGRRPEALLFSLTRPELFTRRSMRDATERKVSVNMEPRWIEDSGFALEGSAAVARLVRTHLAMHRFEPSSRMVALAEQMLRIPRYAEAARSLYLESRALDLVIEALARLDEADASNAVPDPMPLAPDEHDRVRLVRALLDRGEADTSVAQLARRFGVNASTLESQFRAATGTSVMAYGRERRLELARAALETRGVRVGEAAAIAGYGSPANFATAFRRHFGVSPRQCRAKV
ncbi:MAG: helix-turn-helix transcriptional regulator [Polyangiales bacterium]